MPIARSAGRGVDGFGLLGLPGSAGDGGGGCCGASEQSGSVLGVELEMTSVSLASSGMGPPEEVDEDYICPICLARPPSGVWLDVGPALVSS